MLLRTLRIRSILISSMLLMTCVSPLVGRAASQEATQPPAGESELAPQLPPVDLPTMNQMGYSFQIDSSWNGDAASVPTDLPMFRFEPISYEEEDVQRIADALGVDGEISSQGEGTYTVEGNGSIFTTPGLLQYSSDVDIPDEELPDDESAIAYAREWLRISDLLPANIGDGSIVARIDAPARLIVGFSPANPAPLLSNTPGIVVTVGPGGTILDARVSWATITTETTFHLRGVDDAFAMIQGRQSYLDVELPDDTFPQGSRITGSATYDAVSIAWATSGAYGEAQFLQPIYVFTGSLAPTGADDTFDITAFVPAVVTAQQPVG